MNRIYSIEILRGIAAWLVVMHHYNQVFFRWDMSSSILGDAFGYFTTHYAKLGVDVFFVISGFIITLTSLNTSSAVTFLLKRYIRIVPAYWFFTLALIPMCYILSPENVYTDWTFSSLIKSLLFIPHENPSRYLGVFPFLSVGWTLNFEMFFYLLFAIFIAKLGRYASLVIIPLLIVLPSIWPLDWPFSIIASSPYLYEFALGVMLCLVYLCRLEEPNKLWVILILLVTVFFFALGGAQDYKFISVPLLVYWCLSINNDFSNTGKKIATYLGSRSYSVYLSHPLVLYMLNEYGQGLLKENEFLFLIIYILSILVLSEFSVRIVESNRLVDKIRGKINHAQ
ncbi:acyltransferase family protein [Vibrio sp. TRT 21S02]|uniref:acyltransferase family protein n=1 Tax=Vibrio sp. TRT 21S02 TaxID=3418507 RepID=UPI003CF9BD31